MAASQKVTSTGAGRVTRRGFVFGVLALAASPTVGRAATAAGPGDDPFGALLAAPTEQVRYSLRLGDREVCSFREIQVQNLWRIVGQDDLHSAAMTSFVSQLVNPGVGVGTPTKQVQRTKPKSSSQQQPEDDEPAAFLRDGTAALPVLARWYEASQQAREAEERLTKFTLEPEEGATPELRDPVIVKLSRDDTGAAKVLGRLQLKEATVATLVYATDGERVKELVLAFKQIAPPEQPLPEAR